MRDRFQHLLPWLFLLVFALSRWPGLMPANFSAAYAVMFCAGVFLRTATTSTAAFATLLLTDLALNLYYQFGKGYEVFTPGGFLYLATNYLGYALLFLGGRRFQPSSRFLSLLLGGVFGALVFYIVTNTASWFINPFRNPEYNRTLASWFNALTRGVGGFPETWTFLRNSLLSSGLFTALFAAAWKFTAAESPADKGEERPESAPTGESQSEEAPA
jgi:hypothetical protein